MNTAFLSSTATAVARLGEISPQFWITLGSGLLVLILGILFLRKLAEANKLILGIVAVLVFATVGFTWIYERTEPTWATPAVSFLANFFPSKG